MAKDNTGITKLPNGNYACRIYKKINGVQYDTTYRKDAETGAPFRTIAEARNYREKMIGILRSGEVNIKKPKSYKFNEVWDCFIEYETSDRAHSTVVKHTSVWNNHIKAAFGNKYISGPKAVSISDIQQYIKQEYQTTTYAYGYILSYAKVFYLLYAVAYKHKMIDRDTYNEYIVDKSTRIKMPKKNEEDRKKVADISIYTQQELEEMHSLFKGTDLEGAFLIASTCGLRESEVFGLTWDNIDFEKETLTVDKQLLRQDGTWCFARLKTDNAYRTIEMPAVLTEYLRERKVKIDEARKKNSFKSRANEIIIDKRSVPNLEIIGADLVNRKLLDGLDGKMLSINSLKFYSKRIRELYGYTLEMHKLRRTHLSYLAAHGFPPKALMERAGHAKLETSMKYYVSKKDDEMQRQVKSILDMITISADDPLVDVDATNPITKEHMVLRVRKSVLENGSTVTT